MSHTKAGMIAVSRRDVLGAMAGAGLLAASARIGRPAHAEAPRRGGRIRVAGMSSSTLDALDPAKGGLSTDYTRHNFFYSGLTRYGQNLVPRMALAESMESDDRALWNVKLKKGVTFHDGSTLTADDVVYSLLRHKVPATGSKVTALADQIMTVKATGPLEVEIQLVSPNADLPSILAASHFLIIKDGTTDFRTANGTGPFKCTTFIPGVRTIAKRYEGHWQDGKPYLDEIELIGIGDQTSRVNALLSGDVHLVIAVNPRSSRVIRATPGYTVQDSPSSLYTNLIMRQDTQPTNDPNFVLAMKYLFDRELLRKAVYRGYATIANDQPIPPSNPYYLEGLPQREFDPDRAGYLLKKAGLMGVRLPMYASPAAEGSVDTASVLQEAAAKIGLKLAVNRVPADGYWSNHWMKHPLGFGNTNPRPTADMIFGQFYKSDAPQNESGWRNDQFDQLLLAARGEADEAKRKQMYGDMQVLVHQHCGVGIPVFISLTDAYDSRIKGYTPSPLGGLMGYSFCDQVWWEDRA